MAFILNAVKRYWFTPFIWGLVVLWWRVIGTDTPNRYLETTGFYPLSTQLNSPRNISLLLMFIILVAPCLYSCIGLFIHWRTKSAFKLSQFILPFTALIPVICLLGLGSLLGTPRHQLDMIEDSQHRYYLVLRPYMDQNGLFLVYECDFEDRNCSEHNIFTALGNSPEEIVSSHSGSLGIENERLYVCIYYENAEESTTLIEDALALVNFNSQIIHGESPLCQRSSSP
jgi:hypothetical protein